MKKLKCLFVFVLLLCCQDILCQETYGESEGLVHALVVLEGWVPTDHLEFVSISRDTIIVDGVLYPAIVRYKSKDHLSYRELRQQLSEGLADTVLLFIRNNRFINRDESEMYLEKKSFTTKRYTQDDFASLRKAGFKLNLTEISGFPPTQFFDCAAEAKAPGKKVTLAEAQRKLAPETVGYPCIYRVAFRLVTQDPDSCEVQEDKAKVVRVLPSDEIDALKGKEPKFYILNFFP